MKRFEALVEEYMQCDKKTLAEMLALRDIRQPDMAPTPVYLPPSDDSLLDPNWKFPKIWCSDHTTDIKLNS